MSVDNQDSTNLISRIVQSLKDKFNMDHIPNDLLVTDASLKSSFEQHISNKMDDCHWIDLQELIRCKYYMKKIHMEQLLWLTFLKSGTGIFKTHKPSIHIWPEEFKTIIQSCVNINETNELLTDPIYFNVTLEYIGHLHYYHQFYQENVDRKIKLLLSYDTNIDSFVDSYINDYIASMKFNYEYKIRMISYNYEEKRLIHEIEQHSLLINVDDVRQMIFCFYNDNLFDRLSFVLFRNNGSKNFVI